VPGAIYLPFGRNVQDVTPEDVRLWLSRWDRGLKTKANYHGLLFGVFAWAVEENALIRVNPGAKTAPSRPTIKAEQPERTWLTEAEFKTFTDIFMAEDSRDLLRVMVGTGLRFGEITALWVEDIDLTKRTLSRLRHMFPPITATFGRPVAGSAYRAQFRSGGLAR